MMKRRNYLICSIIAMLSIVSYACETEYATCEGCGITNEKPGGVDSENGGQPGNNSSSDNNNSSDNDNNSDNNSNGNPGAEDQKPDQMTCDNNNTYRCDEASNKLQHCENGQWKSLEKSSICKDDRTINKCVKGILDFNKCIPPEVCVEGECREKSTCTKDGYVCKDGVLYECSEGDQNVKQVSIKAACEKGKVVWCDKNKSGEPNKTGCVEIDSKVKICVGAKLTSADKKFCECCNNG